MSYEMGTGGKWDPVWFKGFCTEKEIDRIINPVTPQDFLLRKRADIVANHTRYTRVFLRKSWLIKNYSFESCFSTQHYNRVINCLDKGDNEKISSITYGDIFEKDVNGIAWIENGNKYISINTALKYFLYFCNLAFIPHRFNIPDYIRHAAATIATRIYLNNETMDFELDPRGRIPKNIHLYINSIVQYELQYIAGHEFSHFLCNHLNKDKTVIKKIINSDTKDFSIRIYNIDQKNEFEADIQSLKRPLYTKSEYSKVYSGSMHFFAALNFVEKIDEVLDPGKFERYQDHPIAVDRFYNVQENTICPLDCNFNELQEVINNAELLAEVIKQDIELNYERFEMYGSVYLDKPNTKWRGKELVDRKDF